MEQETIDEAVNTLTEQMNDYLTRVHDLEQRAKRLKERADHLDKAIKFLLDAQAPEDGEQLIEQIRAHPAVWPWD